MKTNKIVAIVAVVLVVVFAFNYNRNTEMPDKSPIKIGASISLTGVAADFGAMSQKAMFMAVDEINAKGGINGRMVELSIEDDATDPKTSLSAYRKLVDINKVSAVIGGIFDFTLHPLIPIAEQEEITLVSPVNFAIDGTLEMNSQTFVMYPNFDEVIRELESVIKEKNIKNLGMIRFESGFSKSIQTTLENIMHNVNSTSLVTETYLGIGTSDFRTNILKIKNQPLDAVFLDMLDFDIIKYMNDARNLGFKKPIIGYTTLRDVVNNKDVNKNDIEGAIMIDWEIPSDEFSKAFFAKYGEMPRRGANKSYDTIYVLAEAIANTNNRKDVPKYMETHSFETLNGSFAFTSEHTVAKTPVKIFEVKNGQLVEIKSSNLK